YFLNAHLSYAHNVIHLASGLAALWFGFRGEISAKKFCYIFGAIYLVLGMLGFVAGVPGVASIANPAEDRFLWNFMPGILELGTSDHIIHILAGGTFILAGLLNFNIKRRVTS
ncbi:MAG TPA: hypothetical protein VN132_11220, partial [Bdellovibrio sp.]|nr:hypothetical protein [Bdellovibrio sp.]